MQDKSEENATQVISIQKICSAYKFIFSEIGPDYHKADFEANKKSLVIALLRELPLPTSLKEEIISAIEMGWTPKISSRELLGTDYETAADSINKFLMELETEVKFSQDLFQSILKYSLDLAGLKDDQLIGNDQRTDSFKVLHEIQSRVKNYLLTGTDVGFSTKNYSNSSRINHKLSQLRSTANTATTDPSSRNKRYYGKNKTQGYRNLKSKITKEKLIAALDDGKTYQDCAEMFGCHYTTVANYAKKFGLSKSQKPALTKDTLEYHLLRMTPAECAEKLGYDKTYIYTCMRRFGLKSGLRRSSGDLEQEIHGAIRDLPSISLEDLANLCEADKTTISNYLNRLIDRGLVQYGYTATTNSEDNPRYVTKYKKTLKDIYLSVKNNPGITSDDLIIRLNRTQDFVLKSLNRLISANLIQFGYVSTGKSGLNTYNYILELDREWKSLEEDYEVSQFFCQNDRNWINEGDNLYNNKNFKDAISCYDRAIEIDPLLADCYYKKGKSLSALSNYEDSIKCFDTALTINPIFLDALFDKGLALIKIRRYVESGLCYDKIIEINPRHASAWYFKGFVASILNQYERALYFYENAIRIDPSMAITWLSRGNIFYKKASYNDASKSYDMALEEDPLYADAWYNKGLVLKKLGNYLEALNAYNKAIDIDKLNYKYWNNKGIVLKNLEKYDEALKCYNKVIELGVVDINLLNNMGNAFYGLKRYKDAIGCYNSAIDLNPKNIIPIYNKGLSMSRLNRIDIAIELYGHIITIDPKFIYAWINKGFAYRNLSNYKESIECFDKAICLEPSIAILWCYKGEILNAMGNYLEANQCYSRAIELNPELAEAWNGNGLALSGLGRYADAREAFSRAKSLRYS